MEDQFAKLQWAPGVGDKTKAAIGATMNKMAALGGLPAPETPQLNSDLAGAVSSLTKTLTGVTDADSAKEALPKLKEIDEKLDSAKETMDKLSDSGKSTIGSLLQAALGKLKTLANKVLAIGGSGAEFKSVVKSIMGKLTGLTK
jgi:hypothetical protein